MPALLAIAGCGAPFTNQPFLDEALFLGALPSHERFGAPRNVVLAPNGPSEVLAAAKASAAQWDAWWDVAIATGQELRTVQADERTDVVREWSAVNVASRLDGAPFGLSPGEAHDWWVHVTITKPVEGDVDWTMEVAAAEDGPYALFAAGRHAETTGTASLDLAALAEALGWSPPAPLGVLDVDYDDLDPAFDDQRTVSGLYRVPGQLDAAFGAASDTVFGFTGPLAITEDGLPWPAYTTAVHAGDAGRAEGVVGAEGGQLTFAACWDAAGAVTYQGGSPGIRGSGAAGDCAIGPFER